jgi:hypothetical protein
VRSPFGEVLAALGRAFDALDVRWWARASAPSPSSLNRISRPPRARRGTARAPAPQGLAPFPDGPAGARLAPAMPLREFLEKQHTGVPEAGPRSKITAWRAAVSAVNARFKDVLGKFDQLRLFDWNVLRDHAGIRYNAEALTIAFDETVITLEPNMIEPEPGILGRSILNCGVREIHLDCGTDGKLWRYHWVIPHDPTSAELTDAAIEELVEELLTSAAP